MALVPATKDGVLCTEGPQPVVSTMLRRWDELLPGGQVKSQGSCCVYCR